MKRPLLMLVALAVVVFLQKHAPERTFQPPSNFGEDPPTGPHHQYIYPGAMGGGCLYSASRLLGPEKVVITQFLTDEHFHVLLIRDEIVPCAPRTP